MSDYRVRARSQGWKGCRTACLAISVGADAHEGAKLAATVDWITAHFDRAIVDVSDTLQRWNLLNEPGTTMGEAAAIARQEGTSWLDRNHGTLARLPSNTEVVRWDRWLADTQYAPVRAELARLHDHNEIFRAAVGADCEAYALRRGGTSASHTSMMANGREFVLEECAAHTLLGRAYPAAKVYPGRSLHSLELLRQGAIAGAPAGLENEVYTRVTLERGQQSRRLSIQGLAA